MKYDTLNYCIPTTLRRLENKMSPNSTSSFSDRCVLLLTFFFIWANIRDTIVFVSSFHPTKSNQVIPRLLDHYFLFCFMKIYCTFLIMIKKKKIRVEIYNEKCIWNNSLSNNSLTLITTTIWDTEKCTLCSTSSTIWMDSPPRKCPLRYLYRAIPYNTRRASIARELLGSSLKRKLS